MRETWAEIDKGAYFHMRAGLQEESSFGVGGRSIIRGYFEQLCTNTLDNLEEKDKFLEITYQD